MIRTLYAKLLFVFLLFCGAMTALFIVVLRASHQQYHLEADQTVSQELARAYVQNRFLAGEDPLSAERVHRGIEELSAANPAVDLYLVDPDGAIVDSSVPIEQLARNRIEMQPVARFLSRQPKLPILGDDPREVAGQRIFSAAPVAIPNSSATHLYVVLRPKEREAAARLKFDYSLGENLAGAATVMVFSAIASLVVLRLLTRRLGRLETAMVRFRDGNFSKVPQDEPLRGYERGDEIERLSTLFAELAELISAQVEKLEQTDAMRRELLTNVSHDLRTPLATLRAHLETLSLHADTVDERERNEYLDASIKEVDRLTRLIDQLLQSARLEAYQVVPEIEPVQLSDLVQDVVQKYEVSARDAQVELIASAPDLPLVLADAGLIERVLENLIDNAIQHTPRHGHIAVSLESTGQRVCCAVSDTGHGIDPAHLERIFDRFYRGDRSGSHHHVGLGLSIARGILKLHGTSLHIESAVGRGSTFSFELTTAPHESKRASA